MFRSVLIANRGEIAVRVIRTAHRIGLRTVAVYSDADADAPFVRLADEAYRIGPAPAARSYLDGEAILAAARRSGAEAIHPGYGFLSENADFAEACVAAGLVFVGPSASAMRAMGLKDRAKALMDAAGVPVVPGYHGDDQAPEALARAAEAIGYPVLVKAAAGGGGKGMRRAGDAKEFHAALAAAQREAKAAFGDDRVLIEKYLSSARHIEVQIFGDTLGNVVHLFERDCSVQRRHQKIVEEAPAPGMAKDVRAAMGRAACEAARAIGYAGAGTVEFIADASDGLRVDRFYFMEMNTRLQVEHPVTEMITGHDLVEWQFRVAAGERLPLDQDALTFRGHAIEARLYAEDAERGFLPSTGRISYLALPPESERLRIDTGVAQGLDISAHYDPMIAKLIAWGPDRASAREGLRAALLRTRLAGPRTNAAFLAALLDHPAFAAGGVDTGFLDRHIAELLDGDRAPASEEIALAVLGLLRARLSERTRTARNGPDPHAPWALSNGWRIVGSARETMRLARSGEAFDVGIAYGGETATLTIGDRQAVAALPGPRSEGFVLDGVRLDGAVAVDGDTVTVMRHGRALVFTVPDPLAADAVDPAAATAVTAPMTGKVTKVWARPGERHRRGDPLVAIEAMKMEHTLAAPGDVTVAEVLVAQGDQVEGGTVLVTFATSDA